MLSLQKWKSISKWLLENKEELTEEEKQYWIEQLSYQNQKMLETWSEQLELLDEVKEKLVDSAPLSFKKKGESLQGVSYFHLGLYDRAVDALKYELDFSEQPSRVYLYLGYAYLYLDEDHFAKEHLLNVIHRTDDTLEKHFALLALGMQAARDDDIEQAISYFENAEKLLFNADVVYNLGICYLLLKMPKEARPYFEKVIESGEGDGEAFYWLGKCYMDSGNKTMAMETWYKAVHEFDSEDLLLSLAVEFEERGLFSCSLFCYERLRDLGCREDIVLHGLSWNYGLMDDQTKAQEGFKKLLTKYPENTNGWISYLWLLTKWGKQDEIHNVKKQIQSHGIDHPLIEKMTD
ncbi:tetratricopeptide (TPR) repeat protein [Evansella vedderi]|uniref:Tetratricopeptide (TPR) repeat protein n=1 Tax=Evansella vedderi TaxID=38282 RepID=A0ABU0A353_9BACI|nr:tetratricopeptide repeat protein [Evansella vedderi]MDQ0257442.1 tetratricopeptide (TPR) repeat protein [Evansella vedderi]